MDVSDVLRDRNEAPSGLQRMVTVSLVAHLTLLAVVVVMQGRLLGRRSDDARTLMTISLSGAGEGPANGGFNKAAAQPVQVQTPPGEVARKEPARAPAKMNDTLVLSTSKRTARTPAPVVKNAPDDAKGRIPTRGAQVTPGNAVAYTGGRGEGFGLSTGGGPGTGSTLDVSDFCCPEYIATMIDRIRSAWQQNQGARGDVRVKFTVQRDGRLTDYAVERPSGITVLDVAALRAIAATRALNPLPAQFPNPTLTVYLNFQYQ